MQVLILGATGGCGRKALAELLSRGGVAVTAVVRSESRLPPDLIGHDNLSVIVAPDGHLALSESNITHLLIHSILMINFAI